MSAPDPDALYQTRTHRRPSAASSWKRVALCVAGLQCLLWGCFIVLWPSLSARCYGFAEPPTELFLWQGMGLVIVLFGLGYVIAATDPAQHWVMILIGLLSKSLGPIGMAWSVHLGSVSRQVLYLIPINDLIWLVPFGMILRDVYRSSRRTCLKD
ncbi:MAG: hypothetical protein KDB01_04870 [Planctomycetaceae bacterium]|nr:hypothetical protein [Planctomycetaceae bacterium]